MKIIFLSISGDGLALAYKLAREGEHEVVASILKPYPGSDHLYENVHVNVQDVEGKPRKLFQIVSKQAIGPLIEQEGNKSLIVFDNNGFGKMADRLRIGKKMTVLGGGSINDRLEYDRDFGFHVMKEHGIDLPESQKFSDWNQAIQFAKKNPKRWVIKVSGKNLPADATRVPDSPEHTLDVLKEMQSKFQGQSFELQEHKDGIIVEVEGWFNGEKFLEPLNLTFEKKKSLTGDLGHNVGCATNVVSGLEKGAPLGEKLLSLAPFLKKNHFVGPIAINYIVSSDGKAYGLEFCYSEDTEVLTPSGWRPMKDVRAGETVCGLNDEGELLYVDVKFTTRLKWNKPLLHIHSSQVYDLMVTPNHQMVFQNREGKLYHRSAKNIRSKGERTKRTSKWTGLDVPFYIIPEHTEQHFLGKHKKSFPILHPSRTIAMNDWCRFLGLFLAEGNCHRGKRAPYQVQIAQTTKLKECEEIIAAIGFRYSYGGHHFRISSIQLGKHLDFLCGRGRAPKKRIPRFILELSPQYIQSFLEGFRIGDGSVHRRTNQISYYTTSKGLADDIAECIFRIGFWARVVPRFNKSAYGTRPCYSVSERRVKMDGMLWPHRHVREIPYSGYVVCLNVTHHRLYVRRGPDGPPMWCANTPRFGYDALYTLLPLLYQEPARFFSNVATGKLNDMPFLDSGLKSVGVNFRYAAVDYPDYEPREAPGSATTPGVVFPKIFPRGLAIGGVNSRTLRSLWFYDVMADEKGRPVTAGVHGILGCCVQTDSSVNVASERVYDILRNMHVDGMEYRTDAGNDIERNLKILSPLIESKKKEIEKEEKQSLNKTSIELPENEEILIQRNRSPNHD